MASTLTAPELTVHNPSHLKAGARPPAASEEQSRCPAKPLARVNVIAEQEFIAAMQAYKASSGRMFPTWSEVLEVLRSLGYQKGGLQA